MAIGDKGVPDGFRVELKTDLTRYHRFLARGAVGRAVPPTGRSAMVGGRFVRARFGCECRFPPGTEVEEPCVRCKQYPVEVDVLLSDLEVTDERWTEWLERERRATESALRDHVAKATLRTTPLGGFVELVVEFDNGLPNGIWKRKSECREIMDDLSRRGLLETVVREG